MSHQGRKISKIKDTSPQTYDPNSIYMHKTMKNKAKKK